MSILLKINHPCLLEARSFSPLGKVQFLQGIFLKPWGHLEVMVEYVVAPIEIYHNPCTHKWIKTHPLMFFNFKTLG